MGEARAAGTTMLGVMHDAALLAELADTVITSAGLGPVGRVCYALSTGNSLGGHHG